MLLGFFYVRESVKTSNRLEKWFGLSRFVSSFRRKEADLFLHREKWFWSKSSVIPSDRFFDVCHPEEENFTLSQLRKLLWRSLVYPPSIWTFREYFSFSHESHVEILEVPAASFSVSGSICCVVVYLLYGDMLPSVSSSGLFGRPLPQCSLFLVWLWFLLFLVWFFPPFPLFASST